MRPSLAARAIPFAMIVLGFKRPFRTPEAMLARVERRRRHPRPTAPQRAIRRRVLIELRTVTGWPVYHLSRRDPAMPGEPNRRVLYLHGGSYVSEITPQHWQLAAELASTTGARVVVPIFPLAPAITAETMVPMAAELAAELVRQVGADNTTVIGDSSGGGMALAVAMDLRDRGIPSPRVVLISPWLDISGTDPQLAVIAPSDPWLAVPGSRAAGRLYRGSLPEDHPMVSPIHGDLAGLGTLTMFSGSRDILNADAARLVQRAADAGLPLDYHAGEGMLHDYPLLPIPEAKTARRAIRDAVLAPIQPDA